MTAPNLHEPPALNGYEYLRPLGRGGFADVFLYRRRLPDQEVAIKVLHRSVYDPVVRSRFESEANLMAAVSHPFIVPIIGADIAEDGRPFLVMPHYSRGTYLHRVRQGRVSVDEVLRVGIQVGCALETAHGARVFHNDIKPSNILLDGFLRPGLTDFGISAVVAPGSNGEAVGISPGYTAPEVVREGLGGSRAADVYGLGATLFTLLAGHSPVERPGGDNGRAALLARIERNDLARLHRPDVPASLDSLLRQALDANPGQRPPSALTFARCLQLVEQEVGFPVTELALNMEDRGEGRWVLPPVEDAPTRLPGKVVIADPSPRPATPQPPAAAAAAFVGAGPVGAGAGGGANRSGHAGWAPGEGRDVKGVHIWPAPPKPEPRKPGEPLTPAAKRWIGLGGAVSVLVVLLAVAAVTFGWGRESRSDMGMVPPPPGPDELPRPLLPPSDIAGVWLDATTLELTWPEPRGGADSYVVRRVRTTEVSGSGADSEAQVEAEGTFRAARTSAPTFTLQGLSPGTEPCIEIVSERRSKLSDPSDLPCFRPFPG